MTARYLTKAALMELADKLSDQDLAVLHRVSDLRFISGDQLRRLHYEDPDSQLSARAARRALQRLTELGCLGRLQRRVGGRRRGSAGFVYHHAPAGQKLAAERGWQPERRRWRSHVPGTMFLDHALGVAELHTLLVEAERCGRIELLALNAEPDCWRSYDGIGGQRKTLKPDTYVEIGAGEFVDSYWIELDRGSEGSRALGAQLGRYLDYAASGIEQAERGVLPMTLWLAPSAQRVELIEECIGLLPNERQRLFCAAPFDQAVNVLSDPEWIAQG